MVTTIIYDYDGAKLQFTGEIGEIGVSLNLVIYFQTRVVLRGTMLKRATNAISEK